MHQVYHELEHFVADPKFLKALERPPSRPAKAASSMFAFLRGKQRLEPLAQLPAVQLSASPEVRDVVLECPCRRIRAVVAGSGGLGVPDARPRPRAAAAARAGIRHALLRRPENSVASLLCCA